MTGPESMRQQVNALVRLVYDADATLDAEALAAAMANEINGMLSTTSPEDDREPVELVEYSILGLMEEAEIYGHIETVEEEKPNPLLEALKSASHLLFELNADLLDDPEDIKTLAMINNAITAAMGGAVYNCTGCNRPEEECSTDPCEAVAKDRLS